MRTWYRLALVILLAGVAGCAEMQSADSLSEDKKKEIYQHVREQVAELQQQAELAEQRGELKSAAESYRKIVFFDPAQTPARTKAERLEKQIPRLAEEQHKRGMKLLRSDKRAALKAFAKALRIDPAHAAARQQAVLLLKEPKNAAEVTRLQQELMTAFQGYGHRAEEIPALDRRAEALLSLDPLHAGALEVRQEIDRDRRKLGLAKLEGKVGRPAREVKPEGTLPQTAAVLPQEPQPTPLVAARAEASAQAAEARRLLAAGSYAEALPHLRRAVQTDPSDPELARIAGELRTEFQPALPELLAQGRRLFNQRQLEEALPLFQCAMELDPGDDLARVYVRKINNRLRTIEQLGQ